VEERRDDSIAQEIVQSDQEDSTRDDPFVFCCSYFIDDRFYNYFVSGGGNGINKCICLEDGDISPLHSYTDEDEESFYTASWACVVERNPFVVAGGFNGRIRVINVNDKMVHKLYWRKTDETRIQPPTRPESKGRKKKQKRIKGKNESPKKKRKVQCGEESPKKLKASREGRTMTCGHCGITGHNAFKCPNSGASVYRKPKKNTLSQGEGPNQESQV